MKLICSQSQQGETVVEVLLPRRSLLLHLQWQHVDGEAEEEAHLEG